MRTLGWRKITLEVAASELPALETRALEFPALEFPVLEFPSWEWSRRPARGDRPGRSLGRRAWAMVHPHVVRVLTLLAILTTLEALQSLVVPGSSSALVIASGDGRGNLLRPAQDPGWHYVGTRVKNGMSVIYLGEGWILTANHVGTEDVQFGDAVYRAVQGSARRLVNDDSAPTDLLLYRIEGNPELPPLPRLRIAKTTPSIGEPVVMIGFGHERGDPVVRQVEPGRWVQGWKWGTESSRRWGTNRIAESGSRVSLRQSVTQAIATIFQPPPDATPFEAQAARGDSGGGLFARAKSHDALSAAKGASGGSRETRSWELVGLIFAVASNTHRKDDVAVFGSYTYAADLAYYRDQILSIIRKPGESAATPMARTPMTGPGSDPSDPEAVRHR